VIQTDHRHGPHAGACRSASRLLREVVPAPSGVGACSFGGRVQGSRSGRQSSCASVRGGCLSTGARVRPGVLVSGFMGVSFGGRPRGRRRRRRPRRLACSGVLALSGAGAQGHTGRRGRERRWRTPEGPVRLGSRSRGPGRNHPAARQDSEVQTRSFAGVGSPASTGGSVKHGRGGAGKPVLRQREGEPQRGERQEGTRRAPASCRTRCLSEGIKPPKPTRLDGGAATRRGLDSNGTGGTGSETGPDLRREQGPEGESSGAFSG
jgi:hypothetical protein